MDGGEWLAFELSSGLTSDSGWISLDRNARWRSSIRRQSFQILQQEQYAHYEDNAFQSVAVAPVSTFSAEVDTSSYSFVRKQLNAGVLPQKDAVRVEEMINYFEYAWPAPKSSVVPFEPTVVVSDSPWGKGRKLVHIGIKGYEIERNEAPDANLVLLLDVSGSMN